MRIAPLVLAIAASGASLAQAQAPQKSAPAPAADNTPAPVIMLVPVEVSNRALESGCWAQFYDERNFKGDVFTMTGPMSIDATEKSAGRSFKHKLDSLQTGPKATVTVYEHQMFKDKSKQFGPNSKETSLTKSLGWGGRIQSVKLDCQS